jgi:hypothetical protein
MVMLWMKNSVSADEWPPLRMIPPSMYDAFTQNGEMPVSAWYYFAQRYSGKAAYVSRWTQQMLDHLVELHRMGKQISGYSLYEVECLPDAFLAHEISTTSGAVIGSEFPWVEAIAFSRHPAIEYGRINSSVSDHRAFTPQEFAAAFLWHEILFDWLASVSSLEHSGLGRYGDHLNPDGDIEAAEE